MKTKLAVICLALVSLAAIDLKQLTPVNQALFGAMRSGYILGRVGATELEMESVFLKIKNGDTNAVQDYLDSRIAELKLTPAPNSLTQ